MPEPKPPTLFDLLKVLIEHDQAPTRQELSTVLDDRLGSGAADLLLNQRTLLELLDYLTLGQVMDLIATKETLELRSAATEDLKAAMTEAGK